MKIRVRSMGRRRRRSPAGRRRWLRGRSPKRGAAPWTVTSPRSELINAHASMRPEQATEESPRALEAKGMEVLVPPDADARKAPSKIGRGGRYQRMRERLARAEAAALTDAPADGRADLRPDQEQPARRALSAPGLSQLPGGMAPDRRHPQPVEGLPQRFCPGRGLSAADRRLPVPRNHSWAGGWCCFARHPPWRVLDKGPRRDVPLRVLMLPQRPVRHRPEREVRTP